MFLLFTSERVDADSSVTFLKELVFFRNLKKLEIDDCRLTVQEVQLLSIAILKLPLHHLAVREEALTSDFLTALAEKTSLRCLNFKQTVFDFDIIPYFNKIFQANQISEFHFSQRTCNPLPIRDAYLLEHATSLVTLKFTPTYLSPTGLNSLATSLSSMRHLRSLKIGGSMNTPDLGEMLPHIPGLDRLEEFSMKENCLKASTISSFCSALDKMTNLRSLTLSRVVPNDDQDLGTLDAIMQSVSTLTKLEQLEISRFSYEAIHTDLNNLKNLTRLNLSFTYLNPIIFLFLYKLKSLHFKQYSGTNSLIPILPALTALENLHVTESLIPDYLVSLMHVAPSTLKEFTVHNGNFEERSLGIDELLASLKKERPDVKVTYDSKV